MRILDYHIVDTTYSCDTAAEVRKFIERGWEPVGSPFTFGRGRPGVAQAMALYGPAATPMSDEATATKSAAYDDLLAENQRLRSAIRWALGVEGSFEPPVDGPHSNYWWRGELRRLSGLELKR